GGDGPQRGGGLGIPGGGVPSGAPDDGGASAATGASDAMPASPVTNPRRVGAGWSHNFLMSVPLGRYRFVGRTAPGRYANSEAGGATFYCSRRTEATRLGWAWGLAVSRTHILHSW